MLCSTAVIVRIALRITPESSIPRRVRVVILAEEVALAVNRAIIAVAVPLVASDIAGRTPDTTGITIARWFITVSNAGVYRDKGASCRGRTATTAAARTAGGS